MRIVPTHSLEVPLSGAQFSPRGEFLLGRIGSSILTFHIEQELELVGRFDATYPLPYSFALHPTENWLVPYGETDLATLHTPLPIYEYPSGKVVHEIIVEGSDVQVAAFSPDGRWLVTGGETQRFDMVSLKNLQIAHRFPGGEWNFSINFHPTEDTIMMSWSSQGDTQLQFCQTSNPAQMLPPAVTWEAIRKADAEIAKQEHINVPSRVISDAVFSPDGTLIGVSHVYPAVYSYPEKQLLWDFRVSPDGVRYDTRAWESGKFWSAPMFTPDSRFLLCSSPEGTLFLWDARSGELLGHSELHLIDLSANGKILTARNLEGVLLICQVEEPLGRNILSVGSA